MAPESEMATNLYDLAWRIRTGTAGPFTLGIDLVFDNKQNYERVKNSGVISPSTISKLYRVPEKEVSIVYLEAGLAIKVTWPYIPPGGNPGNRDAYGGQQHIPLITLKIP
jgi:hypothetical protein